LANWLATSASTRSDHDCVYQEAPLIYQNAITPEALRARIDCVVIGASAGGVEALAVLLPALPATFHPSLLIVLHLPRQGPSLLVEIYAKRCTLPIREADDKEPLEPGTVYFAPPDYHMLVEKNRQIALSADEPVHFSRPSIDVLFESAADVYGERLLGIILTGGNEDGAAGLHAIHQAGGVTVVQQPDSAKVPLMVVSALQRGPADFVLSLPEIAQLLGALA
jgi:two-component system chemotaxis response regulator CheB